jgi:hypothetical protein
VCCCGSVCKVFFFYGGKQKAKIFFNFFLSQLMKVSKKNLELTKILNELREWNEGKKVRIRRRKKKKLGKREKHGGENYI